MKLRFIILILFGSCLSPKDDAITGIVKIDTIKPEVEIKSYECAYSFQGYFEKYGYVISNFYEELDYWFIDLDNDSLNDTLSILSPRNMVTPSENKICENEKKSNRLLLINKKGRKFLFYNVIRNEFGNATIGAEFIEKTNNGFKLSYHKGQSCFLDYDINVSYFDDSFFIDSIKLRSGCPGDKEKIAIIKYSKQEFPLTNYKRTMIDSLKNLISGK